MENQRIADSSDTTTINPAPVGEYPGSVQAKTNLLLPAILTLLVGAGIFGLGGYFVGKQSLKTLDVVSNRQPTPSPVATIKTTTDTTSWKPHTVEISPGKGSYTIKYPEEAFDVKFVKSQGMGEDYTTLTSKGIKRDNNYEVTSGIEMHLVFMGQEEPQALLEEPVEIVRLGDIVAKKKIITNKIMTIVEYRYEISSKTNGVKEYVQARAFIAPPDEQKSIDLADQILSTFSN